MTQRDLAGYGRTPPHPRWPGDARVAVQFVLNIEEGAESSILNEDAAPPTDDPAPLLRKVRGTGMRAGIALAPETPVDLALALLDEVDDVIVLSVHPGWAGQPFQPRALPKLSALRAEIDRRGVAVDVHVDGGVSLSTAPSCVAAGATVLVAASAIFGAEDPGRAARDLKRLVEAA